MVVVVGSVVTGSVDVVVVTGLVLVPGLLVEGFTVQPEAMIIDTASSRVINEWLNRDLLSIWINATSRD